MIEHAPELLEALEPLFKVLPPGEAMPQLIPLAPLGGEAAKVAAEIEPKLPAEELRAGLWLYVDDLDRSHRISQGLLNNVGSFWHGIMHRREGDFSNSKYWFRQAGRVPFRMADYNPSRFVDAVFCARGTNPPNLLELQRREWEALMSVCATFGKWGEQ